MVTPPPAPLPADGDPVDSDPVDSDLVDADLDAGDLVAWLAATRTALRGDADADVDCTGCTACCTSSQFVLIGPDEADALAHVPTELRFPAPGLPPGHVVLGYDERGRCPMLGDAGCTIYAHRPRTCRTYDCRVFAASGLELDDPDKAAIRDRARRWRFTVDDEPAEAAALAVRAAGAFLAGHPEVLDGTPVPPTTTQLAVLATELHDLFLDGAEPSADEVRATVLARAGDRGPG